MIIIFYQLPHFIFITFYQLPYLIFIIRCWHNTTHKNSRQVTQFNVMDKNTSFDLKFGHRSESIWDSKGRCQKTYLRNLPAEGVRSSKGEGKPFQIWKQFVADFPRGIFSSYIDLCIFTKMTNSEMRGFPQGCSQFLSPNGGKVTFGNAPPFPQRKNAGFEA